MGQLYNKKDASNPLSRVEGVSSLLIKNDILRIVIGIKPEIFKESV